MGKKVHLGYIKSMNILTDHLLEWSLLVGLLIFLTYGMLAIKGENSSYIKDSYYIEYGLLRLAIPNWWTQETLGDQSLKFFRSDTRYDWEAVFSKITPLKLENLENIFDEYLKENQIEFDKEVIVETNPAHLFRNKKLIDTYTEFIRVEGMATEKGINRIYLDIVLTRQTGDKGYFLFKSLSSVLNGGVEGPYFESCLAGAEFIESTEDA